VSRHILPELSKSDRILLLAMALGFVLAVPAWLSGAGLAYNLLIFVASLLLLIKSADVLVDRSSKIARLFGIPAIFIGITVVAFGTSLPELTVSAIANLTGSPGISIGNVVGSNITNICLVLGIAAMLVPIKVNRDVFRFDVPFLLVSSLLLPLVSLRMFFDPAGPEYVIGLVDGIILLVIFAFFVYKQAVSAGEYSSERERKRDNEDEARRKRKRLMGYAVFLVAGLAGLMVSAGLLVDSGREIARIFGVPEVIIGLTMIAVGTSLPELATNVVAALKKKLDIAIGNVIGSNVFNVLLVLGTSAVIKPIEITAQATIFYDIPIMIGLTIVFIILMRSGRAISRANGIALFVLYVLYIVYLFTRTG
jgi:cation:H+ antiporter